MLAKLFAQWNPFNVFGDEIDIEDIIRAPLQSNETLMQDSKGHFRRIKTPCRHSKVWERLFFWIQIHLNQNGHSKAINDLISLFQRQVLQDPPTVTESLEEFYLKIERLLSLKNDYGFVYLQEGDPSQIEQRLLIIRQQAYKIFASTQQQRALEEENRRKRAFFVFKEAIDRGIALLSHEYQPNLCRDRLLIFAVADTIKPLFIMRMENLQARLVLLWGISQRIEEMKHLHEGKFTIPFIDYYFRHFLIKVRSELHKLRVEAILMMENLTINSQISPMNREGVFFILEQISDDRLKIRHEKQRCEGDLLDEEFQQVGCFVQKCLNTTRLA